MTVQDFVMEAGEALRDFFEGTGVDYIKVEESEIVKANDARMHSLRIRYEDDFIGRAVYLDDLYERYENGEEFESLIGEAVERCLDSLEFEMPILPAGDELGFENVRDKLSVRLFSVRNNVSFMADRPYIDVGCGLAMTVVIGSERSAASEWVINVTNSLLETEIHCTKETLLTAALANSVEIEPAVLMPLSYFVYRNYMEAAGGGVPNLNLLEDDDLDRELLGVPLMLTNRSTVFGASALFYPGVMERIANLLEGGYYVLPSSVHELIIISETLNPDLAEMQRTVREANETVVERADLLSDNLFHYDPAKEELEVVRDEVIGCVRDRSVNRSIA